MSTNYSVWRPYPLSHALLMVSLCEGVILDRLRAVHVDLWAFSPLSKAHQYSGQNSRDGVIG